MSQGFNLDNQGTGFALDDDEDLEALLDTAGAAEGSDDEDTSIFFQDDAAPAPVYREPVASSQDDYSDFPAHEEAPPAPKPTPPPVEVYEAPAPAASSYNEYEALVAASEADKPKPAYEPPTPAYVAPAAVVSAPEPAAPPARSWDQTPSSSFSAPSAPAPEPAPVARRAPFTVTPTPPPSRHAAPVEMTSPAFLRRAIQVLDAYRALDRDSKHVVAQFITSGEDLLEAEADLILAVFAVDPTLAKTMRALKESKDLDPVERAFYIVGLHDDILYSLGDLVTVFTKVDFTGGGDRIGFARKLVKEIEQLDSRSIAYVEATEAVLAASLDEKE